MPILTVFLRGGRERIGEVCLHLSAESVDREAPHTHSESERKSGEKIRMHATCEWLFTFQINVCKIKGGGVMEG